MTDKKKFEKYKEIKKQIATKYRGYALEKIIALDLIVEVYVNRKFTLKSLISYIIKHRFPLFFSSLNLENLRINEPSKTLFSMGIYERKDYYEIWEYAKSHVDSHLSFDFSKESRANKFNINNIVRAWKVFGKTKNLGLLAKYNLTSKLVYYLNIIDDLEHIAPVASKYCSFSSVHEHETILTYYFKKKGVPTYSLQHGLYSIFKDEIPLDSILYDNFVSDYHLCWGQSTKNEFGNYGINQDSLIVAGYPRQVEREPVPEKLNQNHCLVLLSRYSFHHKNIKLLDILKEYTQNNPVTVNLKLHPSLLHNREQYEDITRQNHWNIIPQETTLTELFKSGEFGWAIGINTDAYYEAYMQRIPCLRFNDGTFEDKVDVMNDHFRNIEELQDNYNNVPFDNKEKLQEYFKKVDQSLDYAIGINTNRYEVLNPGK